MGRRPAPRVAFPRMDPDATYKHLLSHPGMVEALLRWLVAERNAMHALVDALDLSTLARLPEQSVSDAGETLRRRSNDMVWRVGLRERAGVDDPGVDDPGAWLYLVVMLEFQSRVDYLMPLRIRGYVDGLHMERWRGRRFRSSDRLAPVLPIVLYTGATPWNAAQQVIDLVTPWTAPPRHGHSTPWWQSDPRFAGDGYVVLDALRVDAEDLPLDNIAAVLTGLENPSRETLSTLLAAVCRHTQAPELRELGRVMLKWGAHRAKQRLGLELGAEDMIRMVRVEDYEDDDAYFAARIEAWNEEFREAGRLLERRDLLRRHAAMKFDAQTADRLGALLEDVTAREAFDSVLAALLQCDTPAELLERAAEAQRRTNGRDLPGDIGDC